jgi:hypothetical protein
MFQIRPDVRNMNIIQEITPTFIETLKKTNTKKTASE